MEIMVMGPSRPSLQAFVGRRVVVVALYGAMGTRRVRNRIYYTVLLREIRDAATGELLADHLWFNRGNVWRKASLAPGDVVSFRARPIEYRTGYWGPDPVRRLMAPPRRDYKLTPPVEVRVIRRAHCSGEAA